MAIIPLRLAIGGHPVAKIRWDLSPDPYDWFFVLCDHVPHYYRPGPLCHYVGICDLDTMYAVYGHIFDLPNLPLAQAFARALLVNPRLICDCCIYCHGIYWPRPMVPRWGQLNTHGYDYRRPSLRDPYTVYPF
jgi:hypothetical protein